MTTDFSFLGLDEPRPSRRGGARPGAGRPPGPTNKEKASADERYAVERAEHERIKREQREFALEVEKKRYVLADEVRQKATQCLAELAQTLRTVPDNLEREGLSIDWCQKVEAVIEAAMTTAAQNMSLMTPE